MNSPAALFARSHYFFASLVAIIILLVASVALADIISGGSSVASSNQVTTTRLTLTAPASTLPGDVLIANISINGGNSAVVSQVPSGWHEIYRTDNDTNIALISCWKVAGSETDPYIWSVDNQTQAEGGITAYSGVDTANPIDATSSNIGFSTTATASSILTHSDNEEVVALFATDLGKTANTQYFTLPTTPSGLTQKYNAPNTPFGPSIAAFDTIQTTTNPSGDISSSIVSNKPHNWAAQIALRPVPPPPPPTIALDSADETMHAVSLNTSLSLFHTTSESNRILFVFIKTTGVSQSTDVLTAADAVRYGGDTMIRATAAPFSGGGHGDGMGYLYYLVAPSTGSHTLSVIADSVTNIRALSVSYTGASQTGILDATSTDSGTASSGFGTVTTVANNVWIVMAQTNDAYEPTAGANTTHRGTSSGGGFGYFDSNGPVGAPGSHSLSWSMPAPGTYSTVTASFAPAP